MTFPQDTARGMLLGLAIGDAVGTTVEFSARGTFAPLTDMIGGGPFELQPGQWTDDTAMAICLAHSLTEKAAWDPVDCMNRFENWRNFGYASCTGTCFDIGIATAQALDRFRANGDPYAGSSDPDTSGNGGIMRLAPAVLAARDLASAHALAVAQSRTTHASAQCLEYAQLFGELLFTGDLDAAQHAPDAKAEANEIHSTGYVVHTYQAAVWAVRKTGSFREAVLLAANLGDDADTVAAVTGQIAGRIYGLAGIPREWVARVAWSDELIGLADTLNALQLDLPRQS